METYTSIIKSAIADYNYKNKIFADKTGTFEILEEDDEFLKLMNVINIDQAYYSIPEYIKAIESEAFRECFNLRRITIPNNVEYIGVGSFCDCIALNSVTFEGNEIKTFEGYTFDGCDSLERINIPEKLEFIDNYCFKDCLSLTSVKIPYTVTDINFGAFMNCKSINTIHISSKTVIVGNNVIDDNERLHASFENCISLEIVHLMLPENKQIHFKKTIDRNNNIIILYSPYNINKDIETTIRKIFNVENEEEFRYYQKNKVDLSKSSIASASEPAKLLSILPENRYLISQY
jgi:hypothetical protein